MGDITILNKTESDHSVDPIDGKILMTSLRNTLMKLKSGFIDENNKVDYKAMIESSTFKEYLNLSEQLNFIDFSTVSSEDEKKAFFINLYNCQMMHALVALESLPESPLKVDGMWSKSGYNIGGMVFTLDDIEHGVLRCNRGHPSKGAPAFNDESDPRRNVVLKNFDPRIHFALNCGAQSCPAIKVYTSEKVDDQLASAAASFCGQEIEVDDEGRVQVSKLLLWYRSDFGNDDVEVLKVLVGHIRDEELKKKINEVISNDSIKEKIVYKDYNWKINCRE